MKKKFLAVLLAAAVSVAGIPAFAADETAPAASVAVSLGTLDGLVRQYNPSALTLYNSLMITRQAYTDAKAYGTDEDIYKAGHSRDLAEATYEEQVQQVIVGAKQTYLSYWHAVSVQAADQAAADRDAKLLTVAAQSLQNGYLSQKDYQAAADSAAKSSQALAAQKAAVAQAEQSLKALVPVPAGVGVSILPPADTDFDFSQVPQINYTNDEFYMKLKNEDIQAAALDYDFTENNAYVINSDEDIANAKLALDQATQQAESSFLNLYNTVTASYAAYQTEQQTAQRKESDLKVDAARLASGYLSQKDYDQESLDLTTLKNSLENDRNSLYLSCLEYVGMRNGYSAGSGGATGSGTAGSNT